MLEVVSLDSNLGFPARLEGCPLPDRRCRGLVVWRLGLATLRAGGLMFRMLRTGKRPAMGESGQAMTEVVMGKGPKPADNVRAFDARSVIDNLGPTIKMPKDG